MAVVVLKVLLLEASAQAVSSVVQI